MNTSDRMDVHCASCYSSRLGKEGPPGSVTDPEPLRFPLSENGWWRSPGLYIPPPLTETERVRRVSFRPSAPRAKGTILDIFDGPETWEGEAFSRRPALETCDTYVVAYLHRGVGRVRDALNKTAWDASVARAAALIAQHTKI